MKNKSALFSNSEKVRSRQVVMLVADAEWDSFNAMMDQHAN